PRTPATTASGCCGPTPTWTPPRWRCSTNNSGWWSSGSGRARRCYRPARSTTGVTRRSGATCSARSCPWCCGRGCSPAWRDRTIRGHVFCPYLALVLRQELQSRLEERGHDLEWADVIQDLDRLQRVEVEQDGKRFLLRSEVQGTCGRVFQAAGVALPPTVQQV